MSFVDLDQWYDPSVFPEIRPGSPWVMEDMVAAQADLPRSIAHATAAAGTELVAALRAAVDANEPIVVCGVGTSGHSAYAVATILNEFLVDSVTAFSPVEFRESDDQARTPREGGVCIAVSHGGGSDSTVRALAATRKRGGTAVLITNSLNASALDVADMVIRTPLKDLSFCHTVGYTSPMIFATQLGAEYRGVEARTDELGDYLRQVERQRASALEIGATLASAERFLVVGSLVDAPTARELALKIAEAAWVPAAMLGVEDALHGHLASHDADSALVVVVTGASGGASAAEQACRVLAAGRSIGLQTAAIVSADVSEVVSSDVLSAGKIVLPSADLPEVVTSLTGGAVALQMLTLGVASVRGTNPDFLRREHAKYRDAVVVGGAKRRRRS